MPLAMLTNRDWMKYQYRFARLIIHKQERDQACDRNDYVGCGKYVSIDHK